MSALPGKRVMLEMGAGNDLHGGDYTKAARRAVQDALHHSSLSFVRALKVDPSQLIVHVTIGVQRPEAVDCAAVAADLPVGQVEVTAALGGLDVPDAAAGDIAVIASAMVDVRLPDSWEPPQ